MSLRRLALAAVPAARTLPVLAVLGVIGAAAWSTNPEAVVTERFAAALKAGPAHDETAAEALVSGSEAFWLAEKRRHDADGAAIEPASWSAPFAEDVAVGDRITISTAKSRRILEVVAVSVVEPTPGSGSAAPADTGARQLAVTCREIGAADGHLTTFLTQAGVGTAKAPRAL